MATGPVQTRPPEIGVWYAGGDYAGVFRRLVVDGIDVTVVLTVSLATALAWVLFADDGQMHSLDPGLFLTWLGVWFAYFVLLKRSTLRTVGYRIGGIRIVNLRGERPSVVSLTLRLLFAFLGPFNFLVDLFWIANDDQRQALRDKFARTYVIRLAAQPAGRGEIKYTYYTLFGANFIFAEVASHPPAAADPHPPARAASGTP